MCQSGQGVYIPASARAAATAAARATQATLLAAALLLPVDDPAAYTLPKKVAWQPVAGLPARRKLVFEPAALPEQSVDRK